MGQNFNSGLVNTQTVLASTETSPAQENLNSVVYVAPDTNPEVYTVPAGKVWLLITVTAFSGGATNNTANVTIGGDTVNLFNANTASANKLFNGILKMDAGDTLTLTAGTVANNFSFSYYEVNA